MKAREYRIATIPQPVQMEFPWEIGSQQFRFSLRTPTQMREETLEADDLNAAIARAMAQAEAWPPQTIITVWNRETGEVWSGTPARTD